MQSTRTYQNLLEFVERVNNDSRSIKSSDQNAEAVRDALYFLSARTWSHLSARTRITTAAAVTDGLVSINGGSTTLTGATNPDDSSSPAWEDDNIDSDWSLEINGNPVDHEVLTVTAQNGITLEYPYVGDNLTTVPYRLFKRFYDLPTDFHTLTRLIDLKQRNKMRRVSRSMFYEMESERAGGTNPYAYTIQPKELNAEASRSSLMQLWLYPYPVQVVQYDVLYQRWPVIPGQDDQVSADVEIVDWPDEYMGVLEAAIEVEVARKNHNQMQTQIALNNLNIKLNAIKDGDIADADDVYIGRYLTTKRGYNRSRVINVTAFPGN